MQRFGAGAKPKTNMIRPKCDKCGEELTAYGALAFSPPETKPDESCGGIEKYHICAACWPKLVAWLQAPNESS